MPSARSGPTPITRDPLPDVLPMTLLLSTWKRTAWPSSGICLVSHGITMRVCLQARNRLARAQQRLTCDQPAR